LRGFTGNRNVFLIDGIRLNNSCWRDGPVQYWNTVDPYLVDRIEIVRGPASVLYGSDALGGAAQAMSRERTSFAPGAHANGRAVYRFSSAEASHIARVEGEGNFGPSGFVVGGTIKDFGDLAAGRGTGMLPETGYDEYDVDAKYTRRLSGEKRIVTALQHTAQDDVPRTHKTVFSRSFYGSTVGTDLRHNFDNTRTLAYVQYHDEKPGGALEGVSASLSWHRQTEELDRITSASKQECRETDVDTLGVWGQVAAATKIGHLTGGVDYYRDFVQSEGHDLASNGTITEFARGEVADDAATDLLGIYLQDRFSPVERLDILLGGRFQYAALDAGVVDPDPLGTTAGLEPFSDSWSSVVGSARALYHITPGFNVFAGVSQGFRTPNLSDTTAVRVALSGQTDYPALGLRPEKTITYEIGFKARGNRASAGAYLYHTDLDDVIRRVSAPQFGANAQSKANFGEGYARGIETEASWTFRPAWTVSGGFAWIETEGDACVDPVTGLTATAATGVVQKTPLDKTPPVRGLIALRWNPDARYWAETIVTMSGEKDRSDYAPSEKSDTERMAPGGTPGWAIVSLRGGYRVRPDVTVNVAVENLTDKDYRLFGSGLNEPGTNVVLSVEGKF
ncbi:MAG: TonB-dependent receptor, partial [Planctomycetota bacterium]